MPRGNYWEMTYDPVRDNPSESRDLASIGGSDAGFREAVVNLPDSAPVETGKKELKSKKRRLNLKGKSFEDCDFRGGLHKASFAGCNFTGCNFTGTHWSIVKFTKCQFTRCHFFHTDFDECTFIDCSYSELSIGSPDVKFRTTSIDIEPFFSAITTNVAHLPEGVKKEYQLSRLEGTKVDVARQLYPFTAPMSDNYFAVHRELVLALARDRIASQRYPGSPNQTGASPIRVKGLNFLFAAFPALVDLGTLRLAGTLTNWGRSLARPIIFAATMTAVFALIYSIKLSSRESLFRAVEVFLVAGYNGDYNLTEQLRDQVWLRVVTILNLLIGLYWYSLIIPVVTRRFLR
jgi:hypothetical protein